MGEDGSSDTERSKRAGNGRVEGGRAPKYPTKPVAVLETHAPRAGRVWGAARCVPRCQGRCPTTVVMPRAPEDYTRSPRRRVITQIVLSRSGRLVSRSGWNNGKSARGHVEAEHAPEGRFVTRTQPINARHARRRHAGLVRRARRCTNSRNRLNHKYDSRAASKARMSSHSARLRYCRSATARASCAGGDTSSQRPGATQPS